MRPLRQRGDNDDVKHPKRQAKPEILALGMSKTAARGHAATIILEIFVTALGATTRRDSPLEPPPTIVAMIAAKRCAASVIVNVSG